MSRRSEAHWPKKRVANLVVARSRDCQSFPQALVGVVEIIDARATVAKLRQWMGRTGSIGVSMKRGRYQPLAKVGTKSKYLGSFNTAEEPAKAYDKAAKALHGERARLNFG